MAKKLKVSKRVKMIIGIVIAVIIIAGGVFAYLIFSGKIILSTNLKNQTISVNPNSVKLESNKQKITIIGKNVKFLKSDSNKSNSAKSHLRFSNVNNKIQGQNNIFENSFSFLLGEPMIRVNSFKVTQESSLINLYTAKAEAEITVSTFPGLPNMMNMQSKTKKEAANEYHYKLIVYNTYPDSKKKGETYKTDFTVISKDN